MASIVIPQEPLPVERYAAEELQYHVKVSTGAELPILRENAPTDLPGRIFLGACHAAGKAGADASALPGNGYVLKTTGSELFITGKDGAGDPLAKDTHEGTLFAVYDLLEDHCGVRWLWPGKMGEIIPSRKSLSLPELNARVEPLLWFKEWRSGNVRGERIWLKRQRFGRSIQPQYGHSFGKYWARFGKTHPEYFSMFPDGTRGMDPKEDPDPQYVHMCVSEPALWRQIIADWKAKGAPQFLNVCENDGWAGCACARCLSWDQPDPDNPVSFDKRLEAAKEVFAGDDGPRGDWPLKLGSLSDRYARFWENVSELAVQVRPDVKVVSYVYDNYRKPPIKARLNPNVLCGLVPQGVFPYSKAESEVFRRDWEGWANSGCMLFLRPNYTLQAPNFPAFYARTLGEDLKFAMAHSMKGADFDSLTSMYSTQGPSLYMLAKILNHPDAAVDTVVDEFCDAFNGAKGDIKDYFALWESVYPQYMTEDYWNRGRSKRKYGGGTYGPFYIAAAEIFTPETMKKAETILDRAAASAAGDQLASARVEWLRKGLTQAELILATQKAWEHRVDTGDKSDFTNAYQTLKDFRVANAEYDKTNFAGLVPREENFERLDQKSK